MRQDASVERAERASSIRASLMAAGALILAISVWLQWGNAEALRPGRLGGLWVLLVTVWTLVLATGGGLALGSRMRALINDELSLRNRARAVAWGFYAMLAAALGLYLLAWSSEVATGDAIRAISAAGLSTALFVYSWLER
ncbi:MAG TPA: hypothetical protein VGB04_04220 [Allosphingosinicella sp.]|jgi:hypothetical protein